MTKRLHPYRTPDLTEKEYFSALAKWWSQFMDAADRRQAIPGLPRDEVHNAFVAWLDYGKAVSVAEVRRRGGLLRQLVRELGVTDVGHLPDERMWLAMCWLVGQYREVWMKVYRAQVEQGA